MKYYLLVIYFLILSCQSQNKEIWTTLSNSDTSKKIDLSKNISLEKLQIKKYTLEELRILRNEIYARKGYIFKSNDLEEYFKKYDWYSPKYSEKQIDKYLSEIDRKNVENIKTLEKRMQEENLLTQQEKVRYKNFSYSDFLDSIPELFLPLDFDNIEYLNKSAYYRFKSMDNKYLEKFEKLKILGKLNLNDTIYALACEGAAALYTFREFYIVNKNGTKLSTFPIPLSYWNSDYELNPNEKSEREISKYNTVVIDAEYNMIINSWEITTYKDSIGNIIEKTYSDTTKTKNEIEELTKFLK